MSNAPWPERLSSGLCGVLGLLLLLAGCNGRGTTNTKKDDPGESADPIPAALIRLERENDAAACRQALQDINTGLELRPSKIELDPATLNESVALLKMNDAEREILQRTSFAPIDGDYLADCFLLRDALRTLDLKDQPPQRRIELAFDWVCRQIYVDRDPHPPAPPWWTLQAGSGNGLDRAYVFLEVLRHLGFDGCLIGPPELASTPSVRTSKGRPERPIFAPIRAVGVRIDDQIYLFDPWQGKPVKATLAQVHSDPSVYEEWFRGLKAAELGKWEIFLATPFLSLAPRMQWLEKQFPGTSLVRLSSDLPRLRERFMAIAKKLDIPCRIWNVEDDLYSPVWIQETYSREMKAQDGSLFPPFKQAYRESHFPTRFIPQLKVNGQPLLGEPRQRIEVLFRLEFVNFFLTPGSPRDHSLRGNFNHATTALADLKDRNDKMRDRIAREGNLDAAIEPWAKEANRIFGAIRAAEESGDSTILAKAREAESHFLRSEASERMLFLVRRQTSRLLGAEAAYQLALITHERAERALARWELAPSEARRSEAERLCQTAVDTWQRSIDNYPELDAEFPDREAHSVALREKCQEVLGMLAAKK